MPIDRRYAELERRGYLTRRMLPDQLQDLQFAVSQAIRGMPFPLTVRLMHRKD